jgi:hypothetical protein
MEDRPTLTCLKLVIGIPYFLWMYLLKLFQVDSATFADREVGQVKQQVDELEALRLKGISYHLRCIQANVKQVVYSFLSWAEGARRPAYLSRKMGAGRDSSRPLLLLRRTTVFFCILITAILVSPVVELFPKLNDGLLAESETPGFPCAAQNGPRNPNLHTA